MKTIIGEKTFCIETGCAGESTVVEGKWGVVNNHCPICGGATLTADEQTEYEISQEDW